MDMAAAAISKECESEDVVEVRKVDKAVEHLQIKHQEDLEVYLSLSEAPQDPSCPPQ
jgi:hypothetical protein